jgi:hypothetical protein
MSVTSPDFESGAYTNFATPAARGEIIKPVALRRNRDDQPVRGHAARQAVEFKTRIVASPPLISERLSPVKLAEREEEL